MSINNKIQGISEVDIILKITSNPINHWSFKSPCQYPYLWLDISPPTKTGHSTKIGKSMPGSPSKSTEVYTLHEWQMKYMWQGQNSMYLLMHRHSINLTKA